MKVMLSKDEFVNHMNGLRAEWDAIDKLYREYNIDIIELDWAYSHNNFEHLLSILMNDKYDYISWWCWETDFGRDKELVSIELEDGNTLEIDTPEVLYDFLVLRG